MKLQSHLTSAVDRCDLSASRLGLFTPGNEPRYPLSCRLSGPLAPADIRSPTDVSGEPVNGPFQGARLGDVQIGRLTCSNLRKARACSCMQLLSTIRPKHIKQNLTNCLRDENSSECAAATIIGNCTAVQNAK